MSNEVFYLSMSTMKCYTAHEAAGMRTFGGKIVRKPKLAPTKLDAHWRGVVDHVLSHLDALVALEGDDSRDEYAEKHNVRSEWLAEAAQHLLGTVEKSRALSNGNLRDAFVTAFCSAVPETIDWLRYTVEETIDQGETDDVDRDDLSVLRQIAKYLAC